MRVFLSWSGDQSHEIAKVLKDWLPQVINALDPWLSSAMDKGARWNSEISGELSKSQAGIICLTPDNLNEPWILFEAGALSKSLNEARVCTFLVGLTPSDVEWPLAQFQATRIEKGEVEKLVGTLNAALPDNERKLDEDALNRSFSKWWPDLEEGVANIARSKSRPKTKRSQEDILMEVLELVRSMVRSVPADSTATGADVLIGTLRSALTKALRDKDQERAAKILQESNWHCIGETDAADIQVTTSIKPTMGGLVLTASIKSLLEDILRPLPTITTFSIFASDGSKLFDYYEDIPF